MVLGAWLHTLSPFVVRLGDGFGLRWYGLSYLAGFVAGYLLLRYLARRGLALIPSERVGDAIMWLIGGVLVGGRLGYVLVYDRALAYSFTSSLPWWDLLAINKGGMASHGGIVGVILAALRISRGWKVASVERIGVCPRLHVLDLTALIAPCGLLFGRVANFINGELLGRIVSPPGVEGSWWSVQFPQELRGWVERGVGSGHAPELSPAQQASLDTLVESAARPGDSFAGAIDRVVEHAARHADQLKPLLASRHPSQLYQAVAEGLVLGAVLWLVFARPRKPGVVGSVFLLTYGVLRILTEFWRLPDPQFLGEDAGRPLGLSRGQWLSAGMVMAGLAALALCLRRAAPRLGGWCTGGRIGAAATEPER